MKNGFTSQSIAPPFPAQTSTDRLLKELNWNTNWRPLRELFFKNPSKNSFEANSIRLSKILLWFTFDFGFKKEKVGFYRSLQPHSV